MREVELPDELEGDYIQPDGLSFERIGKPISVEPEHHFDLEFLPSQPLCVSHVHRVLFLAHSSGFYVARTKDVIGAAIGEKHSGSLRDLCLVDVNNLPVGFRVRILALSADDSTLSVVSFSHQMLFYSVASFLDQEKNPCFSCSLNENHVIKDLQWRKTEENSFLVISNQRELYYGAVGAPPKRVLENVDAVDWSPRGKYVAAARENNIEIYSSEFKNELSIHLRFESWLDDSSASNIVKVDCIKWVRGDSLVVGCFQQSEVDEEASYLIQVITSVNGNITDVDSGFVARSFYEIFIGLADNFVPFGSGPYLMLSYLKSCQLAIVANKKNIDQHIVFLGWSEEEGNPTLAVLDHPKDSWRPRIELQGNGEDNLILGLCIDEVSIYGKVEVETFYEERKERLPACVLMYLTLDGKFVMYHVMSGESGAIGNSIKDAEQHVPDKFYTGFDYKPKASQDLVPTKQCSNPDFRHHGYNSSLQVSIPSGKMSVGGKTISFGNEEVHKSLASTAVSDAAKVHNASTNLNVSGNIFLLPGKETVKSGFELENSSIRPNSPTFSNGRTLTEYKKPIDALPSISDQPLRSLLDNFAQGSNRSIGSKNTYKFPTSQSSEESFPSQFGSIRDMTKELDKLLLSIEEASVLDSGKCVLNTVDEMKDEMVSLIQRCHSWKTTTDERRDKVQNLLDETVQVMARKMYLEDIFKQSSDTKYWDIWDQQKLNSELELKRTHIQQLSQDIVRKIMDIEKHFNNIEFQKFSGNDAFKRNQRESTRSSVSLQSLQNTMCLQISAAEQLSERLMKQMNQLSIQSPTVKKNAKTELFESIGITQDSSLKTPDATINNKQRPMLPLNSPINSLSDSRRKRDSIQKKLTTMTPTKTTVKRVLIPDHKKVKSPHLGQSDTFNHQNFKGTISPYQSPLSINQGQKIDIVSSQNSETSKKSANTARASTFASFPVLSGAHKNDQVVPPPFPSPVVGKNDQFTRTFFPSPSPSISGKNNQPAPPLFSSPNHSEIYKNDQIVRPLFPSSTHSGVIKSDQVAPTLISSPTHSVGGKKDQISPTLFSPPSHSEVSKKDQVATISFSPPSHSEVSKKDQIATSLFSPPSHSEVSEKDQIGPSLFSPPSNSEVSKKDQIGPSLFSPPSNSEVSKKDQIATTWDSTPTQFEEGKSDPIAATSIPLPTSLQKSSPTHHEPSSTNKSNEISSDKSPNTSSPNQPIHNPFATKSEPIPAVGFFSSSSQNQNTILEKLSSALPSATIVSESPKVESSTPLNLPMFAQIVQTNEDTMEPDKTDDLEEEDGMEEEAPESSQANFLNLGNLGGFGGLGTGTNPPKQTPSANPFGPTFSGATPTSFPMAPSGGDFFRSASFTIPPPAATVHTPPGNVGGFGGQSSFGQPLKIGSAQQALDSVLGSFGQSRQLGSGFGFGSGGNNASSGSGGGSGFAGAPSGGFSAMSSSGRGFAGLASGGGGFPGAPSSGGGFGGGFAGAASSGGFGGGFAGAASSGGFSGGFAGAASSGGFSGGFAAAATSGGFGGGFAGAASGSGFGSGFAGAATGGGFAGGFAGGFGGASSGGGGFGGFGGGNTAAGRSQLFTQMRK